MTVKKQKKEREKDMHDGVVRWQSETHFHGGFFYLRRTMNYLGFCVANYNRENTGTGIAELLTTDEYETKLVNYSLNSFTLCYIFFFFIA
jgi:hypothetical protein